tara:strand:+ start:338 stop:511 length:174 start_codon:yes stop_codon:yes gene_type:complete
MAPKGKKITFYTGTGDGKVTDTMGPYPNLEFTEKAKKLPSHTAKSADGTLGNATSNS